MIHSSSSNPPSKQTGAPKSFPRWKAFLDSKTIIKKKNCFRLGHLFSEGRAGSLIMQITSLVLNRKFQTDWFKIPFLGEAETAVWVSY